MQAWFEHPAIQAGGGPLLAALVVAALFARTRFAWLAIVAGYSAMLALTVGFQFTPLSASRKVMVLVLAAPVLGLALDSFAGKAKWARAVLAVAAAGAAVWAFSSVLVQRDTLDAIVQGALVAGCAAGVVWLSIGLRGDGLAAGAAGLGLGMAAGIAALLSASTGYFMAGIAIAAASGAMLLVQIAAGRAIPAGFTGTLSIGVATALFAGASLMIAKLPWYALPLLLLVPAAAALSVGTRIPVWVRAGLMSAASLVAGGAPVAAAWFATRA